MHIHKMKTLNYIVKVKSLKKVFFLPSAAWVFVAPVQGAEGAGAHKF